MKRNFKVVAILFTVAGILVGIGAFIFTEQPLKRMFILLCISFLGSAILQTILYRRQKTLFKDRPTHPEYGRRG